MKPATLSLYSLAFVFLLMAFTPAKIMDADDHNIVNVASETENLSTLVKALKAAGLVETLEGEGPFTVFAPTNEAFNKLPEGTLESLLMPENKEKLKQILTYHVVAGKVASGDLVNGMTAETVEGSEIRITMGDHVMINDATVVTADVEASNGVVHIIDTVIMPPQKEMGSSY